MLSIRFLKFVYVCLELRSHFPSALKYLLEISKGGGDRNTKGRFSFDLTQDERKKALIRRGEKMINAY